MNFVVFIHHIFICSTCRQTFRPYHIFEHSSMMIDSANAGAFSSWSLLERYTVYSAGWVSTALTSCVDNDLPFTTTTTPCTVAGFLQQPVQNHLYWDRTILCCIIKMTLIILWAGISSLCAVRMTKWQWLLFLSSDSKWNTSRYWPLVFLSRHQSVNNAQIEPPGLLQLKGGHPRKSVAQPSLCAAAVASAGVGASPGNAGRQ